MPLRTGHTPNDLAEVFNDVHRHGTAALRAGDYKGFGDAIAVERSLIEEQREDIAELRANLEKQRAALGRIRKPIQPKGKRRRSRANSR